MGYGVHRFIGSVDANLLCGICSSVLEDAVLTPCGHSFCLICLETWLARPASSTCPECRGKVLPNEARPIHSVRNLINGLNIHCDNCSRGCKVIVKLDRLQMHVDVCGYCPVKCAGCDTTVSRHDLADHQMKCEAIAAAVEDDEEAENQMTRYHLRSPRRCLGERTSEVSELALRVASLELQLKRMKRDLELANAKNRKLEKELKRTKEELEEKRNQLLDYQYVDFDPDYEYGYAPHTIAKLSCLIARFLLNKPSYIDRNRIFNAAKRCYDSYSRSGDSYEHDVHMLIATSYASNWFTENQKVHFHCWLQGLARYRQQSATHDLTVFSFK